MTTKKRKKEKVVAVTKANPEEENVEVLCMGRGLVALQFVMSSRALNRPVGRSIARLLLNRYGIQDDVL